MPTPQYPNPAPPQAIVSMQNSVMPGNATAIGLAYLDDDGNAVIVTESTPLPVTGGGGGGGDATAANQALQITEAGTTNSLLASVVGEAEGAAPSGVVMVAAVDFNDETTVVPLYSKSGLLQVQPTNDVSQPLSVAEPRANTGTTTEFSATTASTLVFQDSRKGLLIFVPPSATNTLYILWGAGTVSPTFHSYAIPPGGAYLVDEKFASIEITGILAGGSGSAFVTSFTAA